MAKAKKLILGSIFVDKEVDPCCGDDTPLGDNSAINGLSISDGKVVLGQDVGQSGDPAVLLSNREIPMDDFTLTYKGGLLTLTSDHQIGGGTALLHVTSTAGSSYQEIARFTADLVTEVGIRTLDASNGFASLIFYGGSGGTALKMTMGYDGPANHVFMADVRNTNSATWEINGAAIGGFIVATGDYWFGASPSFTDEAKVHIFSRGTGQTSTFNALKVRTTASTFNTTSGALISYGGYFLSEATRSSGANTLTNVGIYATAGSAQLNYAAIFDQGQVGIGTNTPVSGSKVHITGGTTYMSFASVNTINTTYELHVDTRLLVGSELFSDSQSNLFYVNSAVTSANLSTIPQKIVAIGKSINYTEDGLSVPIDNHSLYNIASHRAGTTLTIADNLRSAMRSVLVIRRRTGFSGAASAAGANAVVNSVTTVPSAIDGCLSVNNTGLSGGNTLTLTGYWAAISATVDMNTNNTITNAIWLNTGGGQVALGSITNGYALYINGHGSAVTNKYAIYQDGTADLNVFLGQTVYGATSKSAAAIIQIDSTTQGFRLPRMTTTQRDAIASPVAGLLIYNTSTNKLNVYTTGWEAVTSA